ncbi:hypothetical protein [Bacillus thuringiensis]|uniref:hypothetical protein n=1 Tax=Bacillus thuringiensis TaxID=1428 RepID=UPI00345B025F
MCTDYGHNIGDVIEVGGEELEVYLLSQVPSKLLGHSRRVFICADGQYYLECSNIECPCPITNATNFYKSKLGFFAKKNVCKSCNTSTTRAKRIEYYHNHKEKKYEQAREWKKNNKDKVREGAKRYYENNKDAITTKTKEWRKNNPEKVRKYVRNWQNNNPEKVREIKHREQKRNAEAYRKRGRKSSQVRRARLAGVRHDIDPLWAVNNFNSVFKDVCGLTGVPLRDRQVEHLLPISKGGGNTEDNVYPAESILNASKNNKNVFDWIVSRPDIDFSFFFKHTLPYLAEKSGKTVIEFINWYDQQYYSHIESVAV